MTGPQFWFIFISGCVTGAAAVVYLIGPREVYRAITRRDRDTRSMEQWQGTRRVFGGQDR